MCDELALIAAAGTSAVFVVVLLLWPPTLASSLQAGKLNVCRIWADGKFDGQLLGDLYIPTVRLRFLDRSLRTDKCGQIPTRRHTLLPDGLKALYEEEEVKSWIDGRDERWPQWLLIRREILERQDEQGAIGVRNKSVVSWFRVWVRWNYDKYRWNKLFREIFMYWINLTVVN